MAIERTEGTFPLDELDGYTVAKGDPDPRGWEVYSSDNQKLGEVKELLVDVQSMNVRYLDVELDKLVALESGRHVLMPVGTARLEEEGNDRVIVQEVAERVRSMPAYQRDGAVKREYEESLFTSLAGGNARVGGESGSNRGDYYDRPEFATTDFYGKRRTTMPRADAHPFAGDMHDAHPVDRESRDPSHDADKDLVDRSADAMDTLTDRVDRHPASSPLRDAPDRLGR